MSCECKIRTVANAKIVWFSSCWHNSDDIGGLIDVLERTLEYVKSRSPDSWVGPYRVLVDRDFEFGIWSIGLVLGEDIIESEHCDCNKDWPNSESEG